MAVNTNKLAAATAVVAAFSMLATPVQAHDRWRGRHHDRVDTGDVIAGVLVLGAIAAIAGAGKRNREERYPSPDDNPNYRTPGQYGRSESRGMDRAVDMCVGEVESRSSRVGTVDTASRTGEGWHVAGVLEGGASYACWIDSGGRLSDVEIGDASEAGYDAPTDDQWDDDNYARAREAQNAAPPLPPEDDGRYDTAQAPDFTQ